MFGLIISACRNLKRMLPEGPVLKDKERIAYLDQSDHAVIYTGPPKVAFPVLPLQVWAATYELDIILVSQNADWNMHEYAQLATPEGPIWLMKDAEEGSLEQFIVADLPNIQAWLPELPVVRKAYPVQVEDKSTDKLLDLRFEYNNIKGEQVIATYQGKPPTTPQKKTNGSTMGHSRDQLLVALDLPYRDFGKKATIQYDGKPYPLKKLLGIVPFQMALQQTQGGASSGQYVLRGSATALESEHIKAEEAVRQSWTLVSEPGKTTVRQNGDVRDLVYEFEGNETLGLKVAYAQQWNKAAPGARFEFAPALPDLRRPFEGRYTSEFVLDIAGQNSNAKGTITAEWLNNDQVQLTITPLEPWWVTDRPMQSTLTYQKDGSVVVNIVMLPASTPKPLQKLK